MKDHSIELPTNFPKPGFYYHYKHFTENPEDSLDSYAYEVIGLGFHTEDDYFLVQYRPLYNAVVYDVANKIGMPVCDSRPLSMFMENVENDGVTHPRFTPITDPTVIAELTKIRDRMYP